LSEDNFPDIIERIFRPTYELFKQLQDYLKVLITLNTATILIIVALLEKIFPSPKLPFLILVCFICFVLPRAASLLMMTFLRRFYDFYVDFNRYLFDTWLSKSPDLSRIDAERTKLQNKTKEILRSTVNLYCLGNYSYLRGIIVLIIFVAVNLLSK